MVRKQIYIEARQESHLKRLARELGVSEATLIRQSLDRALLVSVAGAHRSHAEAWAEIRALIRRRMRKGPVPGKRRWRRDDLYAR